MEVTLVFIVLFLVIFGITYLFFSTRNKERMALIEKGAEASIFVQQKAERTLPVWKILILNLALTIMGIGAGIILGGAIQEYLNWRHWVMPGTIFLMGGTGLLIGFFITKRMDKS